MDLGLQDKVVLVTGGSDGLGAAVAARVAEAGAAVAICARGHERLEQVAERLRSTGADVLAVRADVTDRAQIEQFVQSAGQRWGRIDALVNNAGVSAAGAFESISDDDWDADLQLKLHAARHATIAALPLLRARGGSVVNVLAIAAKAPPGSSMPSSVSRAAGMALTKALSREVGADAVRVNAVLVGVIESDQWVRRAAAQEVPVEEVHAQLVRSLDIPLGRVGRAEEFADLVTYLVSERSTYVTGTAINVDGGLSPVV